MPVLSIAGTEDSFVPHDVARIAAETAPEGSLESFEGCGHAPFLEEGERYREVLMRFVEGLG